MEKLALVSRHIVLVDERLPIYGAICICGEQIDSVVRYAEDFPIDAVLNSLRDWNPVNLEEHFISPGIIDLEVYVSAETGGYLRTTETAIKGGVTMFVEHPNPYY
jgi:dihydroorotase-like cyclic amidohydrolase